MNWLLFYFLIVLGFGLGFLAIFISIIIYSIFKNRRMFVDDNIIYQVK